MERFEFKKMHGLGNDFVIVDCRDGQELPGRNIIEKISDRHFGVGCDQFVVLQNSEKADVRANFYNADGSESGACGNASRCIGRLMAEEDRAEGFIETGGGLLPYRILEDLVEVDMGAAKSLEDSDLSYESVSNPVLVDMGNPHCVFFVDDTEDIDVERIGKHFESHAHFPNRTNVEFVGVIGDNLLRQRTWERGVGVTLACGSGACAVCAAAFHRGLTGRKIDIRLDGGTLQIEIRDGDDHILMTGPTAHIFDGLLKLP